VIFLNVFQVVQNFSEHPKRLYRESFDSSVLPASKRLSLIRVGSLIIIVIMLSDITITCVEHDLLIKTKLTAVVTRSLCSKINVFAHFSHL
jgi:hypothetical protein